MASHRIARKGEKHIFRPPYRTQYHKYRRADKIAQQKTPTGVELFLSLCSLALVLLLGLEEEGAVDVG
jgi:hypothetical protein